jgi:hypothetical protein
VRGTFIVGGFESLDPLVQILVNAAVLAFNYVSGAALDKESRRNCTEIRRRVVHLWRIIQRHGSSTIAMSKGGPPGKP